MAEIVQQILSKPVQYAAEITKLSKSVVNFRSDCEEIAKKTEKLSELFRQVVRSKNDLYERPTRRIMDETEQVLAKALILVTKCTAGGFKRLYTIIPAGSLKKITQQLENSIGDVSWLLRVSTPPDDRDDDYLGGLPPIAANEPILCLIWEQIAILCTASVEERTDAAASLVSLARDNDRYGKLIIEEGGVAPLLKLAKEGRVEGQESAARAIGLLGRDPESVQEIVNAGVCQVFEKMLKDNQMKVQVVVAWAVSELAAHYPKCQDHFAQNNIIRLLVSHLAFETIQEHSKYSIATTNKQAVMSIHAVVGLNNPNQINNHLDDHDHDKHLGNGTNNKNKIVHPLGNQASTNQIHNLVLTMKDNMKHGQGDVPGPETTHKPGKGNHQGKGNHVAASGGSIKGGRELEDPATKAEMKAMSARALRYLCAGNVPICRSVTESRALLCFAVLLEKGPPEVQYNSAMALMEITAVAEQDAELRRVAFKPTAPAAKAVVDQFLRIIQKPDLDLIIPSIRSIGNLARTFRATETRFIGPLVHLLDDREPEVISEAAIALSKFAHPDNFLHVNHCKAIIKDMGHKHLIPLVYFGEQMVQIPSFILLCYLAMHVPDNEALGQEEVPTVLEWATKQGTLMQDKELEHLVYEAKKRLELYQSRTTKEYT